MMYKRKAILVTALFILILLVAVSCANEAGRQPQDAQDAHETVQGETAGQDQTTPTDATYDAVTTSSAPEEEPHYWEGDDPDFTGYPEPPYSDSDVKMLAKTVYGEASVCCVDEQRLVIWTILQRVDANCWSNTISGVLTQKNQFAGYKENNPVDPDIYALCSSELAEWWHGAEPPTHEIYAPTIPYYFFDGDGRHNWFREEW